MSDQVKESSGLAVSSKSENGAVTNGTDGEVSVNLFCGLLRESLVTDEACPWPFSHSISILVEVSIVMKVQN